MCHIRGGYPSSILWRVKSWALWSTLSLSVFISDGGWGRKLILSQWLPTKPHVSRKDCSQSREVSRFKTWSKTTHFICFHVPRTYMLIRGAVFLIVCYQCLLVFKLMVNFSKYCLVALCIELELGMISLYSLKWLELGGETPCCAKTEM